jgi:hypothetical protein
VFWALSFYPSYDEYCICTLYSYHRVCSHLSQQFPLREQWVKLDGQWGPLPTATGRTVSVVRQSAMTSHVAGHWSFVTVSFDNILRLRMLVASYHKWCTVNPVALLKLSGCGQISVVHVACHSIQSYITLSSEFSLYRAAYFMC